MSDPEDDAYAEDARRDNEEDTAHDANEMYDLAQEEDDNQ